MTGDDEILIGDAARLLGLSNDYTARLADSGQIPCRRHPRSGYRIFHRADVERYAAQRTVAAADTGGVRPARPMIRLNLPPGADPDLVLFGRGKRRTVGEVRAALARISEVTP